MTIKLLHHTPLWVASTAIRKCWASEDKSDTCHHNEILFDETYAAECQECGCTYQSDLEDPPEVGPKDRELIHRVGNKNKHASTLEHLNYSFDIDGISRACLQELARHRHASISVKSTRYTLKELKNDGPIVNFLVDVNDANINLRNIKKLEELRELLNKGQIGNDLAKYMLPEAFKTSLVWTVNARSLQNFLALRTNRSALWEIQELANNIFNNLPNEHKYLFEEFVS